MRERRFDLTLLQALWWDDGKLTTVIGVEFYFDPDRRDTALFSASFSTPVAVLHIYTSRWPILSVEPWFSAWWKSKRKHT